MVIWAKTVIKESLMEFSELSEEAGEEEPHPAPARLIHIVKRETEPEETCDDSDHFELIFGVLRAVTPILFAFIIEFALIGATVFYNMWTHIEPHHRADTTYDKLPRRPNARKLIQKTDWSYSSYGAIAGLIMLIFNMVALGAFFQWSSIDTYLDEYIEKVMRSLTNSLGIIAACIGSIQVKKMVARSSQEDSTVDQFLLNLGAAFTFIYMSLSISIGTSRAHDDSFPSSLLIVDGVLSISQIIVQIVFINLIMNHATKREDFSHPGRQMTTFLILVNFSLWFVNTFELQKSQASPVESEVYGAVTWVWLQRLTLPLVIFFRCVDSICPYSLLYFRSKLFFVSGSTPQLCSLTAGRTHT